MEPLIVDYKKAFPDAIAAHGAGKNLLVLRKRTHPAGLYQGNTNTYELAYFSLAATCQHKFDEAWAYILWREDSVWMENEIPELKALQQKKITLFDMFRLDDCSAFPRIYDIGSKPEVFAIQEIGEAMKHTGIGCDLKCWWNDKIINATINYGVRMGWLFRLSTTQVHWTEPGIEELQKHKTKMEA